MHLFTPLTLRSITLRNRLGISPMCQYSAVDGFANDWHLVHLGARAIGGAALVMVEATAVLPEGRISPGDLGLWSDAQVEPLARIARFMSAQGSVPAVQLAHAGRKASTAAPWDGHREVPVERGGWQTVAPSALRFDAGYPMPDALDEAGIDQVVQAFAEAARRSLQAGFQIVELHAAHGYLLHQFLSPISNRRTDRYGGSFENRTRLVVECVDAIRGEWPESLPLFVRLSATDWVEGGWSVDETVRLAALLREHGVDLIDCSSGGLSPLQQIPVGPGYQVPFAERVRAETGLKTAAVGLITTPQQADDLVREGRADLVFIARESLRNPHFPLDAANALDRDLDWPRQYARAKP